MWSFVSRSCSKNFGRKAFCFWIPACLLSRPGRCVRLLQDLVPTALAPSLVWGAHAALQLLRGSACGRHSGHEAPGTCTISQDPPSAGFIVNYLWWDSFPCIIFPGGVDFHWVLKGRLPESSASVVSQKFPHHSAEKFSTRSGCQLAAGESSLPWSSGLSI